MCPLTGGGVCVRNAGEDHVRASGGMEPDAGGSLAT